MVMHVDFSAPVLLLDVEFTRDGLNSLREDMEATWQNETCNANL